MRLREKKELSGEMGMSSMTDIIFILLIFFMMVSTMVSPSAINLTLPGNAKTSTQPVNTDRLDDVGISATGSFILNGLTTAPETLKKSLAERQLRKKDYKITVTPDPKAPVEQLVWILDITQTMGISAILQADTE